MSSTKALIDINNLISNINTIKSFLSPSTKLLMPVKANAYGHGSLLCAQAAQSNGIDFLSIARVSEGQFLRENNITLPILLFSLANPDEIAPMVQLDITPFVFDKEYIDLVAQAAREANKKNYKVHLAVDSGMGRIGCRKEEALELALYIESKGLCLEGMCTHMAVSDSITEENRIYTQKQFDYFMEACTSVKNAGINVPLCHCCNSAATFDHKEMHLDMVRPGITFYGYYPDEITREYLESAGKATDLKPVMTLITEVCSIRSFHKGESIGYGRTWTCTEDTDIAVLPIGYGDGLFRRFGQKGLKVAINGAEYPVVGRICMDQCMVNIGKSSGIHRWDKAVIFGDRKHGALQSAQEIADNTSTISYEITSAITDRVPRTRII